MARSTKIDIHRPRRLGRLIRDSLLFSNRQFFPLIKFYLIFIIPLAVACNFVFIFFAIGIRERFLGDLLTSRGMVPRSIDLLGNSASILTILLAILTLSSLYLTLNSFILHYGEKLDSSVKIAEVWQDWKAHIVHFWGIGLIRFAICFPFMLLWEYWGYLIPIKVLVTLAIVFLGVSTSLSSVIRMNESCGVIQAIRKSFKLVNQSWWETFFAYLVLGIFQLLFLLGTVILFGLIMGLTEEVTGRFSYINMIVAMALIIALGLSFAAIFASYWTAGVLQYFSISLEPSRASTTFELINQIGKSDDFPSNDEINTHL